MQIQRPPWESGQCGGVVIQGVSLLIALFRRVCMMRNLEFRFYITGFISAFQKKVLELKYLTRLIKSYFPTFSKIPILKETPCSIETIAKQTPKQAIQHTTTVLTDFQTFLKQNEFLQLGLNRYQIFYVFLINSINLQFNGI